MREDEKGDLEWVYRKLGTGTPATDSGTTRRPDVVETRKENAESDVTGVLKARVDQDWNLGLLWEGRVKELLYSCGVSVDFRKGENMFRGVGVEVLYSS